MGRWGVGGGGGGIFHCDTHALGQTGVPGSNCRVQCDQFSLCLSLSASTSLALSLSPLSFCHSLPCCLSIPLSASLSVCLTLSHREAMSSRTLFLSLPFSFYLSVPPCIMVMLASHPGGGGGGGGGRCVCVYVFVCVCVRFLESIAGLLTPRCCRVVVSITVGVPQLQGGGGGEREGQRELQDESEGGSCMDKIDLSLK